MMATMEPLTLTHHAILLRGEREEVLSVLANTLGVLFTSVAHPDITYMHTDALTIADVRTLHERAHEKPIEHTTTTCVIDAASINTEAQHALLKLTEDPPQNARFVFVVPHSAPLLPTLRSRLSEVLISTQKITRREEGNEPLAKVMKRIAAAVKVKDDAEMEAMLRNAEGRLKGSLNEKERGRFAAALLMARRYIEARGSSPKMLLEHLTLSEREAS